MVPVWYAVLLLVCFASAASTTTLYTTEADRVEAAEAINASPGLVALYGPILDVHSEGELAMTKMTVVYAALVALMLVFVVRRHTRLDEENGQAELLAGTAITTSAPLAAALAFGSCVSVLLGLLAAGANTAAGLPVAGSLAFGASWGAPGWSPPDSPRWRARSRRARGPAPPSPRRPSSPSSCSGPWGTPPRRPG
jgi:ABC-2 type transport system permease protein